jgi:ABC-type lipoprotein release transport system permease subunit
VNVSKLIRLVLQSIRRNRRDFALSSIGIVVGISTLFLFTALGSGIKSVVLEEIFTVRQLEVVPQSYDVGAFKSGGFMGGPKLDDRTVERLRNVEGVAAAYPKMKLTFPSSARGGERFVGQNLILELVADGIPPTMVDDQLDGSVEFRDWGGEISCGSNSDCPAGHQCTDGTCRGDSCNPRQKDACPDPTYCQHDTRRCAMPIPVIVSPRLLEIYNGSLHTSLSGAKGAISNMPKLSKEALLGFEVEAIFGRSYLGQSKQGDPMRRRLRLVGFSERAIDMGATMPIGYVERLNRQFRGEDAAHNYHSIVVETRANKDVSAVAETITDDMGLTLSDDYERAQRAGLLVTIVTLVFNLVALVILAISAINIMHTFLMIVLERRREIGLMRALGATKGGIRLTILGESTILGLVGGVAGLVVGWGLIEGIDYLFRTQIGTFPFKPDSLFAIHPWMALAALGVALVFCWLGALLPAWRASGIDPAEALTGH